jgi:magnesium transporter
MQDVQGTPDGPEVAGSAQLHQWLDDRQYDQLRSWFDEATALEGARELSRADDDAAGAAFRLLERERQLELFEMLEVADQQRLLDGMLDGRARTLIADMDVDDRARLLGELPAKVAARLLSGMRTKDLNDTATLLGYAEGTAGRIMSPDYVSLKQHMTAAQALEKIRSRALDAETIYTLPVLDDERRLVGVVGLRRILLADPGEQVAALLFDTDVYSVSVSDDRETAARLVRDAGLIAVPVLDGEQRLVGVITVDDAMDVLKEEETEDAALHGGSSPLGRPYLNAGVLQLARSRAVWLLALIVAAALTVNVLQYFEDTLSRLVTLALFIPLLIDTGGNAGAQASTVVTRALAVGEIRPEDLRRVLWRESRTGALLGVMLAGAALMPVWLLFGGPMAVVVSTTLAVVCAWASTVGAALPLAARRFGGDPAVVSAPVVTTLVDATGLVIYFFVARAVLGL